LGRDKELPGRVVVLNAENVRLAADLAIFDVDLAAARGFVDPRRIPFTARSTLEAGFHVAKEHTL